MSACDVETVSVSVFNVSYLFGPDVDMNQEAVTPSGEAARKILGFC